MLHVRTSQLIIAGDGCSIQGYVFPRCMAMEDIRCDVDENLWPDLQEQHVLCSPCYLCSIVNKILAHVI